MAIAYTVIGILIGIGAFVLYSSYITHVTASVARSSQKPRSDLPHGVTRDKACAILQSKYRIDSLSRLSELNPSVAFHWTNLHCEIVNEPESGTEPVAADSSTAPALDSSSNLQNTGHHPVSDPAPRDPASGHSRSDVEVHIHRCVEMMNEHHVVPGSSWGTLTIELQRDWSRLKCDVAVHGGGGAVSGPVAGSSGSGGDASADISAADVAKLSSKVKRGKDGKVIPQDNTALPVIDPTVAEWCVVNRDKYGVLPMKSWGRLPLNMIEIWKSRKCDLTFTAARMVKRPLSKCFGNETSIAPVPAGPATAKEKGKIGLPLIAIMAATTTRKVERPSTDSMALFTYLLPSLIRSLDCGFRYEYILGYDLGDPFYDSAEGMSQVTRWFKNNVEVPMKKNGIDFSLRPVKVNNSVKKPGPVFVAMARAAYEAGAQYFYRVNDDTEVLANWPNLFVKAIHSLPPPYAVVGPLCNQGNQKILTHDFVHRLHMDIFEMNYYPPELVDWWMDDWISLVYGKQRTYKASESPVMHHTGAHGQRYEVDRNNEALLVKLVEKGRGLIRAWMLKNNVSEKDIAAFDADQYTAGFEHIDVPGAPPRQPLHHPARLGHKIKGFKSH